MLVSSGIDIEASLFPLRCSTVHKLERLERSLAQMFTYVRTSTSIAPTRTRIINLSLHTMRFKSEMGVVRSGIGSM